jgi:hypothetical protein
VGKRGPESTPKLYAAPENPTKKDLIRAVSSLSVFFLTMQVDQITKNIVIRRVNTVNDYLKRPN